MCLWIDVKEGEEIRRLLDAINFMVEVLRQGNQKRVKKKKLEGLVSGLSEDTCLQKQRIRGKGGGSEDKFSVLLRLSITGCEMEWRRNLETIVTGLNV